MTTVEVERAGVFEEIPYGEFSIETGTSDTRLAPEATITTSNNVAIQPNQRLRITIDGTTRFEGRTISGGSRRGDGRRRVQAEHDAFRIFNEAVSVSGSTDAATILSDALAATSFGSFTLDYTGASETLGEPYAVGGRKVKQIFRDIADRTNRVFWVDAVANTITVQPRGGRGEFASVTLPGDPASVQEYENGSVRSVTNDVTVVGTGEERVEGRATDSASISDYGRRSEQYNVAYVTTQAEAQNAAAELLSPEPLDSASVLLGSSIGTNPDQTLANYQLRVTDPSVGLNDDVFVIQSQKIEQGRVEVDIGEAATSGIGSINRSQKSDRDTFEGDDLTKIQGDLDDVDDGANFGKILQSAIDNGRHTLQEAVGDLDNIDDGGQFARVNEGNVDADNNVLLATTVGDLDDIEDGTNFGKVSTTAISAGDIILAEAIGDLDDIEDGTNFGKVDITNITPGGAVFSSGVSIDEGTGKSLNDMTTTDVTKNTTVIEGGQIETGSLTADEIDALDLDTDQLTITDPGTGAEVEFFGSVNGGIAIEPTEEVALGSPFSDPFSAAYVQQVVPENDNEGSVGSSISAYADIYAYEFIDAGTGTAINDGGDPRAGVADGHGPPDHASVTDDEGNQKGYSINRMVRDAWNVIREQDRVIRDLEDRLETLEGEVGVGPNA